MRRLEGSRWRLRRARGMRQAMGFEWVLFRLLFGPKRKCRHFQCCGEVRQIPPNAWRIISRAASAAPAASFWPVTSLQSLLPPSHLCRLAAEAIKVSALPRVGMDFEK
jgi:hypothetical protein